MIPRSESNLESGTSCESFKSSSPTLRHLLLDCQLNQTGTDSYRSNLTHWVLIPEMGSGAWLLLCSVVQSGDENRTLLRTPIICLTDEGFPLSNSTDDVPADKLSLCKVLHADTTAFCKLTSTKTSQTWSSESNILSWSEGKSRSRTDAHVTLTEK